MTSHTIQTVLDSWRLENNQPKDFWRRHLTLPPPQPDIVTIITGVRRCGKSTLLNQLLQDWNLSQDLCFSINFEDPRLSDRLDYTLLDEILNFARQQQTGPCYFFFDEIQAVANWQKWLRLQTDRPNNNYFIVTGSNASLLSGELSTVLTGRHLSSELFPLSWAEYHAVFPQDSLSHYLDRGGFPRALQAREPEKLLAQYFLDIVEKDIRERLNARSVSDLRRVLKTVFESVGSELSLRRLAANVGLSVDTLASYLGAAENAYLCFCCSYFSYSERQRSHRNRKYYAVDTALRKAVITPTGADRGKDFENLVYLTLRRKYKEIHYWKGVKEVDFVVETERGLQPIQVSWDAIKDRHEVALDEFYKEFRNALDPVYVTSENFADWAIRWSVEN